MKTPNVLLKNCKTKKKYLKYSQLTSISHCRNFLNNLHEATEIFPSVNNLCLQLWHI